MVDILEACSKILSELNIPNEATKHKNIRNILINFFTEIFYHKDIILFKYVFYIKIMLCSELAFNENEKSLKRRAGTMSKWHSADDELTRCQVGGEGKSVQALRPPLKTQCRSGGIGRRVRFRCVWWQHLEGSSPFFDIFYIGFLLWQLLIYLK